MKLRSKMLTGILGTVVLVFIIVGVTVGMSSNESARVAAENLSMRSAREAAVRVARGFEAYKNKLEGLSIVIESMKRDSSARENLVNWMEKLLVGMPDATAVWLAFEENQFDGLDAGLAGQQGFGPKGRMVVIFNRSDGAISRLTEGIEDDLALDFYQRPLTTGQPSLMEPYKFSFPSGKEHLLVTFGRPIRLDGKVVGVIGVDIDMQAIQKIIDGIHSTPNSSTFILSNQGVIAGTQDQAMLGKKITDWESGDASLAQAVKAIQAGDELLLYRHSKALQQKMLFSYAPIEIEGINTPWSLMNATPESEAMADAKALSRHLMLFFTVGLLIIALVLYFMIRSIVRPIKAITERVDVFSNLDFRQDLSKRWLTTLTDEIGDMARSLRLLQDNLVGILDQLAAETNVFMDSARALASLSEETVASTEEVKASVDEAATLSESNAASLQLTNTEVQKVSHAATMTAKAAEEGADAATETASLGKAVSLQVAQVVAKIDDVGDKSRDSGESISKVGNSVAAIANFVSTIAGIADQTNLLALNAAIEAARAGEAGRGFAVVAEEVRKLAEESNLAAREVEKLIGTLQGDTKSADRVINEMNQILKETVDIVRNAEGKLNESMSQTHTLNGIMQNMASTAEQQAAASGEMTHSVEQVTHDTQDVVQSLSAIKKAMEETARASEQVAEEAQSMTQGVDHLRQIVERFTLD